MDEWRRSEPEVGVQDTRFGYPLVEDWSKLFPLLPSRSGYGMAHRLRFSLASPVTSVFPKTMVGRLLPEPYQMMAFTALCLGLRIEEILALAWKKVDFARLCMRIDEAVVHGRIAPVKTEYSEDELPLDPEFATKLLLWKRASKGEEFGLVFPSHITGGCYHASPLQQDWIRRAGFCLVECPECCAAPGKRCKGMKQTNSKRPRIQVHDARRDAAIAAGYGGIGWHAFRHKYRTLLSGGERPLEVQQKLMRQADIRTTMGYGGAPMENRRAANSQVARTILLRKSEQ